MLGQPLSKGRLELHDAQGRHVLTETFSGIQGFIGTPHMAPGLYAVTLRDAQGAVVEQLRWLKE
jgi:hypothetical protein